MRTFWRTHRRKVFLVCLGVFFGLLAAEGGLRVLGTMKPSQMTEDLKGLNEYVVQDEELRVRIQPNAPGHDAWGFRNEVVPERVDIVAIGDSQTWGVNAERRDAWPQTLGRVSGLSVYNMGLGYYGTVEYWVLVEEALKLSPDIVLIGLYLGNDIWGAYYSVYEQDVYTQLRDSAAEATFGVDTIQTKYVELREAQAAASEKVEEESAGIETSFIADLARTARRYSHILQLIWRTWGPDSAYPKASAWAHANPEDSATYTNDDVRMVLQPTYRLIAMDLDNPRVAEGLRITREVLGYARQEIEAAGAQLQVVLIPTQELVVVDAIQQAGGQLNSNYGKLVDMETLARNSIAEYCEENGIDLIDPLPAFRDAIARNEVTYPPLADGHPLGAGYHIIAEAVNQHLSETRK